MSLIKDRKDNSSGAYERILGNKKLDNLISKIHATTISAGRELENLILSETNAYIVDDISDFNKIINNEKILDKEIYLIRKKVIKESKISHKNEPDFIVIEFHSKELNIIELKEGYVFDTKKSEGELNNLKEFSNFISSKISYKTNIFICCFHINNKDVIFRGLKKKVPLDNIMTGDKFCKLLGLNYKKIMEIRKKEINENFKYFIDQLMEIPEIENELKNIILSRNS
ncbi:MAG: hypothetical protein ACRDCF_00110 [Mycoplasmoidaceae bacterium]